MLSISVLCHDQLLLIFHNRSENSAIKTFKIYIPLQIVHSFWNKTPTSSDILFSIILKHTAFFSTKCSQAQHSHVMKKIGNIEHNSRAHNLNFTLTGR